MLGKQVNELQSDVVVIPNEEITGTLHYVTGYTGFNGSDPTEQEGNYLALKITASEGTTTTVELVGGKTGPVELDEDMNCVLLVSNKDTQTVKIKSTNDSGAVAEENYALSGLVLEPKAEE